MFSPLIISCFKAYSFDVCFLLFSKGCTQVVALQIRSTSLSSGVSTKKRLKLSAGICAALIILIKAVVFPAPVGASITLNVIFFVLSFFIRPFSHKFREGFRLLLPYV